MLLINRTMKFRNSPFLLAVALILSSPLMAHASACSNSTIRGSYAFTIHGKVSLQDGLAYSLMVSPRRRLMAKGI